MVLRVLQFRLGRDAPQAQNVMEPRKKGVTAMSDDDTMPVNQPAWPAKVAIRKSDGKCQLEAILDGFGPTHMKKGLVHP